MKIERKVSCEHMKRVTLIARKLSRLKALPGYAHLDRIRRMQRDRDRVSLAVIANVYWTVQFLKSTFPIFPLTLPFADTC
jgi:hypothetical protein